MPPLLVPAAAIKAQLSFNGSAYGSTPKLWGLGYLGNWNTPGSAAYDPVKAAGVLAFNSVVQACIAWMQRTYPEPRLVVQQREDDEWKEVPGHPLTRLLARPNKFYATAQLWQRTLADWVPTGNAYWVKRRDKAGKVKELWHRPECAMRPTWDSDEEFVSRYLHREQSGKEEPWPVEDVVHFRFGYDPQNERLGWSPLRAGLNEIATLNNGAAYRSGLLDQQGVPAYALEVPDKDVAQELQDKPQSWVDDLRARFRALFSKFGAGGLFVPTFPAKLVRVGFSPAELDIISMLGWDADIVCALLGLNSMVVNLPSGAGGRTYANQADAREAAFECNIIPCQGANAEDLTLQLLGDFEEDVENFRVAWDYSKVRVLQGDEIRKQTVLLLAQKQSALTVTEARSLGWSLKPLDAKQEAEIEAAKPKPPALGPPGAESPGDRRASSQGQPFSRNGVTGQGGNGKALAVKVETEYVVPEVDPGEIAAAEFSDLDQFWEGRRSRWADEVEGEEDASKG